MRLSNSGGVVFSTPVTLTVIQSAPTVSVWPGILEVHGGEVAAFSAQASGNEPFTYQWRRGPQPLVSATDATLDFPTFGPGDAGSCTVSVNSAAGSATSGPGTLNVFARPRLSLLQAAGSVANMSAPVWNAERTNVAAGTTHTFTNVDGNSPRQFWRVRVVPPAP